MTAKQPRVGVGVIVRKDNLILLGVRKNAHGAGLWAFPGGHLEFNETIEDCSVREVLEETGLVISTPRKVTFVNDFFEQEGLHYVTLYMLSDWISGEPAPKEPDKCDGWYWFPYNDLPALLSPNIAVLVKKVFSNPDFIMRRATVKELCHVYARTQYGLSGICLLEAGKEIEIGNKMIFNNQTHFELAYHIFKDCQQLFIEADKIKFKD